MRRWSVPPRMEASRSLRFCARPAAGQRRRPSDAGTGTVRLKGEFPNRDNSLFPNQFVNVRILVDVLRDVTLVPSAAIQRGTQGTYVFVVKDDQTVSVRTVKTGPTQGEKSAVTDGVAPGELVVETGSARRRR